MSKYDNNFLNDDENKKKELHVEIVRLILKIATDFFFSDRLCVKLHTCLLSTNLLFLFLTVTFQLAASCDLLLRSPENTYYVTHEYDK